MKSSTFILLLLNVLAWGYLTFSGYEGVHGIEQQRVPGYPNSGQFQYYVLVPPAVFAVSVLWPLCLPRARLWVRNVVPSVTLAILPFYLFFYTGGV